MLKNTGIEAVGENTEKLLPYLYLGSSLCSRIQVLKQLEQIQRRYFLTYIREPAYAYVGNIW